MKLKVYSVARWLAGEPYQPPWTSDVPNANSLARYVPGHKFK